MKNTSFIIPIVLSILLIACSSQQDNTSKSIGLVKVDGSSTVFPITEVAAEEYQAESRVHVTVGISGTGGGFKKFCRGETDIQNASRPILINEMEACQQAGITYIELPVAFDALTVVINPNNHFIQQMTIAELKKIWAPEAQQTITSWQQVNPAWPNEPLKLFGAGSDSGTFDYFTEAIVGKAKSSRGDFTASEDDNVLVQGVINDKSALGYFGYAYYEQNKQRIKAVPIALNTESKAVFPSAQSVMDGSYQPLSRPLFIYVSAKAVDARPEVKAFVEHYLTHASDYVKEAGFIALPASDMQAVTQHWNNRKLGTGFGGTPEVGVKIEDLLKRVKN